MQASIIRTAPQMRSPLPYTLIVFAGCAAVAMLAFFAGRGSDGSFEPMALKDKLDAMPRWAHGALTCALLVLLAVEFDCIGRLLAFPIARIGFVGSVTRRRLAIIRFAVLSVLLAWIVLNMVWGSWPAPHGWVTPAFFGVLFMPIALSVIEWMRNGEAPRHDLFRIDRLLGF